MFEWSLGNLSAWSVQAAALVAAGAWLPTRLRLGVPRTRLLLFRLLLVACVGLPLAQPWRPGAAPAQEDPGIAAPLVAVDLDAAAVGPAPREQPPALPAVPLTTRVREWAAAVPWPLVVVGVLAAGSIIRIGWLALGLVSLARLRRSSTVIDRPTESIAEAMGAVGVVATFRESPRVPRPVTFGLRTPVVIVPPGFTTLDPRQQKAVACHELLHVKRQDWLRTLGDEIIRGLLWFHPGIWWLVEQIHLTAEQTIDREVVALVGDRRSYLRALLALAESGAGPRLQPAACFLDHGHLRQRVAMLMEEASMSRVRLVASLVFVLTVLGAGGWWSVSAFPLHGAPAPASVLLPLGGVPVGGGVFTPAPFAANQPPPPAVPAPPGPPPAPPAPPAPPQQATRPGMATAPVGATLDEATLKRNIQLNPKDLTNYFALGRLYEKSGDMVKAVATYEAAIKVAPNDGAPYMLAASAYNRQGNFEKAMDALSRRAATNPQNPEAHYVMAAYYWEKAYRDFRLSESEKRTYIDKGLAAADRAIALNPQYTEALTYKNLLLRSQALLEADPEAQKLLIAEADRLRERAITIRKTRQAAGEPSDTYPVARVGGMVGYAAPPPPPPPPSAKVVAGAPVPPDAPPPPPPPPPSAKVVAGAPVPPDAPPPPPPPDGPVRVGGNIKPPTKIVDVKAILPEEARAARVQGVVIVEATIGEDGKVRDAKILRSIPMLDQAALDAVSQWEFTPTTLNGVPVPVIMTVTVNFTLE